MKSLNTVGRRCLCVATLLLLAVVAMAADDVSKRIDTNMAVLLERRESNPNKFIRLAQETAQLAEEEERYDVVGQCYRTLIIYILYNVNTDRAIAELNNLRWFTERTGEGTADLYTSWQNIVVRYYNENDVLHAVTECHEMLQYAEKQGNDYGMALAYTAMGVVSSHSYDAALEILNLALQHIHLCDNRENEYYIHYIMATSALTAKKWDKVLKHVDEMMAVDTKPDNAVMYAHQLRMCAYLELGMQKEAKAIYDTIRRQWDRGEVQSYFEDEFGIIMSRYLCKYGNPDEMMPYVSYITTEDEKARVWAEYYAAKRDYANAYKWRTVCDSIHKATMLERTRAEVASANVYYNTLQLKERSQQLTIDNANRRSMMLFVGMCALFVLLIGAVVVIVFTRRRNSKSESQQAAIKEQTLIEEQTPTEDEPDRDNC